MQPQNGGDRRRRIGVVFSHEHMQFGELGFDLGRLYRSLRRGRRQWHRHRELGAFAGALAGRGNGSAMQVDQALHDGQSKSHSLSHGGRCTLPEWFEDMRQKPRVDAVARVSDTDDRPSADGLDDEGYRSAAGCVFHRIRQQVPNHLLQPVRVAKDRDRLDRCNHVDSDLLGRRRRPDRLDRRVDHGARVEGGHRQAHPPLDHVRHVEQIFNQARLHLGVAVDRTHRMLPLRIVHDDA